MTADPKTPSGAAAQAGALDPERLFRVLELVSALASEADLEALLSAAADAALAALEPERVFIVLREGEERSFEVSRNFDREDLREPEQKVSQSVIAQVLETGGTIEAEDAAEEGPLKAHQSVARLRLRSLLAVPIRVRGRTAGVLYVDNRFRRGAFGPAERRLLEAIASACAVAIERRDLLEDARSGRARAEESASALRSTLQSQRVELSRLAEVALARFDDQALRGDYSFIVGRAPVMKKALALTDRIARSEVPVLVTGESGTGKELIARALHQNGPRKLGPFVKENFAAIPESLAESELFGHVKGAFTGAVQDRPGLFELASGGTLFLDEVGDMSLELQKKLLRVLQEGEVRRVGGQKQIQVNVRVVAATHRDLRAGVERGTFREDLFYRLNVVEIRLPALRERPEDIPALVEHFLKRAAEADGREKPRGISRQALRHLARRPWPGNVRELENAVKRLHALSGDVISGKDILDLEEAHARAAAEKGEGAAGAPGGADKGALPTLEALERAHIERVLAATAYRPTEAARILGISYTTLWRKMKAMGLRAARST